MTYTNDITWNGGWIDYKQTVECPRVQSLTTLAKNGAHRPLEPNLSGRQTYNGFDLRLLGRLPQGLECSFKRATAGAVLSSETLQETFHATSFVYDVQDSEMYDILIYKIAINVRYT